MPLGVVAPRSLREVEYALAIARDEGVSVTARGGGTSQCGQTINSTLIVDCPRYLDHVIELDVAGKRCVVEPGIVLDELNRKLKPHGLWFPEGLDCVFDLTLTPERPLAIGGMPRPKLLGGRMRERLGTGGGT